MNINPKNQTQFELFPKTSRKAQDPWKPSRLTKDLTLPLENIIVLCIIFVMVLVLFFSFGVERGRRIAIAKAPEAEPLGVRMAEEKALAAEEPVPVSAGEERVVFPVSVPQEIREEVGPDIKPPIEKTDEQEKLFTIQVASFKREENAQREADRLKAIVHDEAFVLPKGGYSIVCVGKFAQHNEAKKFSSKLKKHYNDCLVRRL